MNENRLKSDCGSVGLYVHIPFCQNKCRYCGFYSEPIAGHNVSRLISALITHLANYDSAEIIKTVYIGGGSPCVLPARQLLRLVKSIAARCGFAREFTVEVNPGQVNEKTLARLYASGVNRLSIGAQSFTQSELDFLGRRHSVENITQAVHAAKKVGFDNINLDLIFAIPGSTPKSWKYSLQAAIDSDIQHISPYSLSYEHNTPLQRAAATGQVIAVNEELDREMYETAIDELTRAGFEHYEISNFARKGFACRHNLGYWASDEYIGIGPAGWFYWKGSRGVNIADIEKYIEAIEAEKSPATQVETLTETQRACETAVLNLRRIAGIDLAEFKRRTGFDVEQLFAEPVRKYEKSGLLRKSADRLFLTRNALAIADSVVCDFASL